jgi:hypothetical protein
MSTAAFPGSIGPELVRRDREVRPSPVTESEEAPIALAIHRITKTHHGRTLLTLGHAAEHLANSRRFRTDEGDGADAEAIHILMGLSREVFDDFAERLPIHRRVERLLMDWVVGLID